MGRDSQTWRDGRGREISCPAPAEQQLSRTTKVVLAAAHLDPDSGHCGGGTAMFGRCASGAICCMTGPSIGAGSG